jgi:hypothetical protein
MNFQYRRGQRPILRHNWTGTIIDGGCGRDGSLIKEAWPTSQYLGKREKKTFSWRRCGVERELDLEVGLLLSCHEFQGIGTPALLHIFYVNFAPTLLAVIFKN